MSRVLTLMAGTSINPLLRAAHLASKNYTVSLLLPWIDITQQPLLFPRCSAYTCMHTHAHIHTYTCLSSFPAASHSTSHASRRSGSGSGCVTCASRPIWRWSPTTVEPTSPGPHAPLVLTSPGPHVVVAWQALEEKLSLHWYPAIYDTMSSS